MESVRTSKGPRQKVVCTLGDLSPRPREEWLKLARRAENALVGREGFPLAHEVFPGNLQNRKSLWLMLDCLHERVGLSEGQTVVVDRGMAYEENIEEIRSRNLHYVAASRQSERDSWLEEFENSGDFEEVERTPSPRRPLLFHLLRRAE